MANSKYRIPDPTYQKAVDRGYTPVRVWKGGWYHGWRVKKGYKWQHVFIIADDAVRRFKIKSKLVKEF